MRGTITTEEKCPICGGKMVDNRRNAVACRDHPSQIARKLRVVFKKDGKLTRRKFSRDSGLRSYMEAQRFLIHLQVEVDEGSFDARDYQASKPLGFANQMEQFLRVKEETLKPASFRPVKLSGGYGAKSLKFLDSAYETIFLIPDKIVYSRDGSYFIGDSGSQAKFSTTKTRPQSMVGTLEAEVGALFRHRRSRKSGASVSLR